MVGEPLVNELKAIIKALKYKGATWEWAIWEKDNFPRLHFLKITLTPKTHRGGPTRLFSASGLSLFRTSSSTKRVLRFLDYCLTTRREHERTNKLPPDEVGFPLGRHTVKLFGNFPIERPDFYGSARAKDHWLLKSERPFFITEYVLHDSGRPQLPPTLSLRSATPPFANPREAYKHYFDISLGERTDPWVGIVLPVDCAYIRSFKTTTDALIVEIDTSLPVPKSLFLSAVCRGREKADFRQRLAVTTKVATFQVGFEPNSVDLALYLGSLQIDLIEWVAPKPASPPSEYFSSVLEERIPGGATSIFSQEFLSQQPTDVRVCLEQAEKCCFHRLWIPASLMLRKTLEFAVNLKMKQLGMEHALYTEKFHEKPLPIRLRLLTNHLPALTRDTDDLLTIKWFGDKGAHSKMDITEDDIRSIVAPRLRAFLTDLQLEHPQDTAS